MVRKEYRGDLWSTLLHSGILKDVVQYIKKCVDDEVPDVNEMPRMWSFEDGIYCAETDTFAYYENVRETFPVLANGFSTYKFMEKHKFAPVYFIENDAVTPRRRNGKGAVDMLESGLSSPRSPRPSPMVGTGHGYGDADDFEDEDDFLSDDESIRAPAMRKRTLEEIQLPNNLVKIFTDQGWSDETIFLKLATAAP